MSQLRVSGRQMLIPESAPTTHGPFQSSRLGVFPNPPIRTRTARAPVKTQAATLLAQTFQGNRERKVGTAHLVLKVSDQHREFTYSNRCIHLGQSLKVEKETL